MGEYAKLRKQTERIVQRAVKLARGARFEVMEKGDAANIVTTSDLFVQSYLCKRLGALLPEAGFYCEEENLKDTESEYIWVIDPIDGTMNYSRGIGECAISVALLRNQRPVLGVVHNLFRRDLFSASVGDGARRNGKPISVSDKPFERSLLFTALSLYKKELAPICSDIINEAYLACSDIRRFGSCAIELCYLAAGEADLYFEVRVFPWDFAAAAFILSEAGGVLRGFDGKTPGYDRPTPIVAANTPENYERLSEIVMRHMPTMPY